MGFDESHIGDSRTLEFEDKFRAVTGGRGMDVVLDSLAGEFVDASLRLVAPAESFWRWARPTSATQRGGPQHPACATAPSTYSNRPGTHASIPARTRKAVRRGRITAAAGDGV
ncbi:phenolphthiocerol synthesis polyketide synthase type I Pks15/1 domain protein [Mycobacterium xenopi 3993]|nr:phenolphthiocerol synthesis polyketide synthase type I Pks15/1 domain protein [Mycobacterium xenopi 3993]